VTALALVAMDWRAISPPIYCWRQNVFDYIRINTGIGCFAWVAFRPNVLDPLPPNALNVAMYVADVKTSMQRFHVIHYIALHKYRSG
jgi:hypothetical protein